jgi:hypothetical protein
MSKKEQDEMSKEERDAWLEKNRAKVQKDMVENLRREG